MTKCNQQHILDEKEKLYFPTDGETVEHSSAFVENDKYNTNLKIGKGFYGCLMKLSQLFHWNRLTNDFDSQK